MTPGTINEQMLDHWALTLCIQCGFSQPFSNFYRINPPLLELTYLAILFAVVYRVL